MGFNEKECLVELRRLTLELGRQGGLVSPSIYETAQVLRLAPVAGACSSTVAWLVAQQRSDGGWGSPATPCARDLPTLAAALALRAQRNAKDVRVAIQAGVSFLRRHAPQHWSETLADDIPVGVELLLPRLLDEALSQGLDLPAAPYATLRALGDRRRRMIAAMAPRAGTAPTHSWEGWGSHSDPEVIDATGGVGHSPAATAAWLAMAAKRDDLVNARRDARGYLEAASAVYRDGVLGLMPAVWPIERFELVWGLHALSVAGLLDHPYLRDAARLRMLDLGRAMRPDGIGMSDHFIVDGDISSTATATLIAAGHRADVRTLRRFQKGDSFITYPNELQPSLTTTAHAVSALALAGDDVSRFAQYLESKQAPDGRWTGDKWHNSWLYSTAEVVTSLARANRAQALPAAVEALIRYQRADGGWGSADRSTLAETAYAALALHALRSRGFCASQAQFPLARAASWLAGAYDVSLLRSDLFWIDKELYCPYRIDHVFVLSALLALHGEFV